MPTSSTGSWRRPETIYEIGSITKQFTAIAIMQLVEQGKVRLEDDFSKYLPDFDAKGRKITVAQLLNHTSGLKNYTALGMQDTFRLDLSTERMADLIAAQPPDFAPGTDWDYTNSGFFLAGMHRREGVGAVVRGVPQEERLRPGGPDLDLLLRPEGDRGRIGPRGTRRRRRAWPTRTRSA